MKPSVISGLSVTGGGISASYAILAIILELPWYIGLYHGLGFLGCFAVYIWASEMEE